MPPCCCREHERAFLAATCGMLVTGVILLAHTGIVPLYRGHESRRSTRRTTSFVKGGAVTASEPVSVDFSNRRRLHPLARFLGAIPSLGSSKR